MLIFQNVGHRLAMACGHTVLTVRSAGRQPRGLPLPPLPAAANMNCSLCGNTYHAPIMGTFLLTFTVDFTIFDT